MAFYAPENFIDAADIEYEQSHRILQPVWDFIRNGHEDALRSPMFPPILAVVFYQIVTILFTLLDQFEEKPFLKQYKIQPNRRISWGMIRNSLVNSFWNYVLLVFPLAFVQLIWVPPTPLPPVAPTLWQFVWQQVAFIFIFDVYYWAWHVIHHKIRYLYRTVHSIHHQYSAPFALMTQYLHPWEIFCVGLGVSMIPWMFKPHCMTYWSWFIVSNWMSIEVHSGYRFPWAAHNFIPLYGVLHIMICII